MKGIDPMTLSVEEKIELVKESDGLLIELLENVKTESIDLSNINITYLPDGLEVKHLGLNNCKKLEFIPESVKVTGTMFIYGCVSLMSLPKSIEDAENEGKISIFFNVVKYRGHEHQGQCGL